MVNTLFLNTSEGLEEASEVLESIVEYYGNSPELVEKQPLSQESGLLANKMLPVEVRGPLILDID